MAKSDRHLRVSGIEGFLKSVFLMLCDFIARLYSVRKSNGTYTN